MDETVKEEFEKLQKKIAEMEIAQIQLKTKTTQPQSVFIKPEKKISKFYGRPVKESDPDVADWITDVREHMVNIPSAENKIEFVLDHLSRTAKTEVRLRPADSKKTAEDILKIIEDTYQVQDTVTQLRHKFYERVQREGENIENYSLALMKLANSVSRKEGSGDSMEKVLVDKFIDGVRDPQLKRELRKYSCENPSIPFLEFRGKILRWIDNRPEACAKVSQVSLKPEPVALNDELLDIVRKQQQMLEHQQQQIDILTSMTKQETGNFNQRNSRGRGYHNSKRGRGRGRGGSTNITCFKCGAEGHMKNECPNLNTDMKSSKNPKA